MPTHSAETSLRLEEGEFVCCCTAQPLSDGAWISAVDFERAERAPGAPGPDPKPHKVPGVFLDCTSALSAAAAYAVRTVQWDRI